MLLRTLGVVILLVSMLAARAGAQTEFTYQGRVIENGLDADGQYDFRFRLFDQAIGGVQIGPTLCANNVQVTQGIFTQTIDFGPVFGDGAYFLELDIRRDTGLSCITDRLFVTLANRQRITPAPLAVALGNLTAVARRDTIDQQQSEGTTPFQLGASGVVEQTFTASMTAGLSSIDVMIGSTLSPRLIVQIIDPTTSQVVGRGDSIISQILSADFTNIPLAVRPGLVAGRPYTIRLEQLAGTAGSISLLRSGSTNPYAGGEFLINGAVQPQDLAFRTHMGSPGSLGVTSALGIGVAAPAAPLHVQGGPPINGAGGGLALIGNPLGASIALDASTIQSRNSSSAAPLRLNPFGGTVLFGSAASPASQTATVGATGAPVALDSGGAIQLFTSAGTSSLLLDGASVQSRNIFSPAAASLQLNPLGGDVGIGTALAAPGARLDVIGDIRSAGPLTGVVVANPNNNAALLRVDWLSDVPRIRVGGSGTGSATGFDIQTNSNVSRLRILQNGNVGIGQATPTARLELGGVAGTDGMKYPDGTLQTTAYRRIKTTGSTSAAILNAGTSTTINFAVPGAVVGDCAVVNFRTALISGVGVTQVLVATDIVAVTLRNAGTTNILLGANTADIVVLK